MYIKEKRPSFQVNKSARPKLPGWHGIVKSVTPGATSAVVGVQLYVLPKAVMASPLFINKWSGDLATSLV